MPEKAIRDLVYFDFDKAMSIWSQFQGGRIEHVLTRSEDSDEANGSVQAGIPRFINVELGARTRGSDLREELRIVHHDLLAKVEESLSSIGLMSDLTTLRPNSDGNVEEIRDFIGESSYVRAEGRSVIEDYQRILAISESFNDLTAVIQRSSIESIKKSEEYQSVRQSIEEQKKAAKGIKDRNERSRKLEEVKSLERNLSRMLESDLSGVEDWILEGMRLWIQTFMPTRINFRIYPFDDFPSFQILCNLKRACFIDEDLQHLLYGYGQRPNVPLTVTGLITSIPPKGGYEFDPLAEFECAEEHLASESSEEENRLAFERAFRGLFQGMEGMENFVRYSRYPNLTVHPIAVYRNLEYR